MAVVLTSTNKQSILPASQLFANQSANVEIRYCTIPAQIIRSPELRAIISDGAVLDDDEPAGTGINVWLSGYGSVYGMVDMGDWHEHLMPGAFDQCLAENPDVFSFWNHDYMYMLGRTSSGTVEVKCDQQGLQYRCNLPMETHLGQYIAVMCDRKDITGASIMFTSEDEHWDFSTQPYQRFIRRVTLHEAGPVYAPAQPLATIGLQRMKSELQRAQESSARQISCNESAWREKTKRQLQLRMRRLEQCQL